MQNNRPKSQSVSISEILQKNPNILLNAIENYDTGKKVQNPLSNLQMAQFKEEVDNNERKIDTLSLEELKALRNAVNNQKQDEEVKLQIRKDNGYASNSLTLYLSIITFILLLTLIIVVNTTIK